MRYFILLWPFVIYINPFKKNVYMLRCSLENMRRKTQLLHYLALLAWWSSSWCVLSLFFPPYHDRYEIGAIGMYNLSTSRGYSTCSRVEDTLRYMVRSFRYAWWAETTASTNIVNTDRSQSTPSNIFVTISVSTEVLQCQSGVVSGIHFKIPYSNITTSYVNIL